MQFWIFFQPGTGGDGFANLLEKSPNVHPLDVVDIGWRIHRIVDGQIKFHAPTPDTGGCFRSNLRPFSLSNNQLQPLYQNLVLCKKNCVITSHDVTMKQLKASDCQHILCQDQVRILLVGDTDTANLQAAKKNLQPQVLNFGSGKSLDYTQFDLIVDIRDIQSDWTNFKHFCKNINIECDQQYHDQYLDLLTGSTRFMNQNHGVEIYESKSVDNQITYDLVDVWQPHT